MIISASVRTDIPAFYGSWFLGRLAAGYCEVINPFNKSRSRVDLSISAVSGFVFWTRNSAPFTEGLNVVQSQGQPFVVQFTLTGYPRLLERSVIEAERGVEQMWALRRRFGPHAVVWRYDPIVITSLTPPAWHLETFSRLADALSGVCTEVVVSFLQVYRKTGRNLTRAAREEGFHWWDPEREEKRALLKILAGIADERGMRFTLCAQPELCAQSGPRETGSREAGLREEGGMKPEIFPARCIDAVRLAEVSGRPLVAREKGNRPGCRCAEARDIGAYESCIHGCVYCYAVGSRSAAQMAQASHDSAAPALRG
jgi:hypothetical protein